MENNEGKDLEQELEALYRKVASTDPPENPPYPLQHLQTGTVAPEEPALPDQTKDCSMPGKERSNHRVLFTAIGVFFFLSLLCLVAIFFWPTIYHYESLPLGEKIYPLRINKLTGETQYLNGTAWLIPPIAEAIKKPASGNINNPAAILPPATGKINAQAERSTVAPTMLSTGDKGKYIIQIKAFPEQEKKAAHAFVEDAKRRLPEIRMTTVHIAGKGVWYRILIGNYASMKEASHDMRELKLSDAYPDSFIRMQPGK